jgi:AmmeMemoRadiSam system protein B
MENVREPAVAGQFYPGQAARLREMVTDFLAQAEPVDKVPKAIIAPHAGYVYSGPIAASAYASLADVGPTIRRVVLLGPAHRVAVQGLAASSADAFATPLGIVPVDKAAIREILSLPQVQMRDVAHVGEHSLEVHLPFLQQLCPEFKLIPLVVGTATANEVAQVLDKLWGGKETLVVISSDLSHYHDYHTARTMDQKTSQAIEELKPEAIGRDQACGRIPIQGLLQLAREKGLKAIIVDVRNSGDTAGPRSEVVGYGAYLFT